MPKEAKKHIIDELLEKHKAACEDIIDKAKKGPAEQSLDPNRQTPHMSPDGIIKRDGKKRFDF